MGKKKTKFQLAQEQTEDAIKKTNQKIAELGKYTSAIHDELSGIQALFDEIRNVPSDKQLQYDKLKAVRLNWKHQADKIESDYKTAAVKNSGAGAAGIGAGVAVAALGPTAAMGFATTFGVASTGTAISALSGAAATNAALAWLGGGALAAGGGGMAAGNAFLALAGPVGWAIAGVAVLSSGLLFWKAKSEKKELEDIFMLISKRDTKSYELAIVELNERIDRIVDETDKLKKAIEAVKSFGNDYNAMSEAQQYELGAYVNLMASSTQLLVNPIAGLLPKYSETDYESYISENKNSANLSKVLSSKSAIIYLSNLLYNIEMPVKITKLLHNAFIKNKAFLQQIEMSKKYFDVSIFDMTYEALKLKYITLTQTEID